MKWFIVVIFTSAVLCFEYDKNNISALDDVVAIKQKCNKHGKDDSYERLTEAIEKTMTCIDEIVHFESVNAEFEKARKTGSLDELFGKYCTRRPEFRKCLSMTTDVAEECLLQNERESLSDMGKWVEQITEFACFKNGDRIAMFVAEGGIDCLISRTRDILNCINDTLKFGEVHFDTTDIDIPNMSINKEKCRDFTKIQECIVQDLEKNCIKHTSANMVDSLLEFIKRNACNSPKEKRSVSYAEIDLSNPPKVNIDDLPLIKEKCEKQGKPETYGKLKEKIQETKTCIEGLIDINGIKNEIEESKKTGSMDEVFGKYCNRRPQLKECIQKSVDVAKECMEESEKQALNVTADLLEEIGNFACFHDGDRLAMFVAEGGLECLKSRSEAIQKCINDTIKIDTAAFSTFSPNSLPATIPNFTVNQEKCDDLTKLQQCVVKDLEDNCKDSTPANIIEAVFKFIKKTACKNPKQRRNNQMQSRRLVKRTIVQFAFTNSSLSTIAKLQQICQKYGSEDSVLNLMIAINKTHCKPIRFLVTPREDMIADLRSCSKPLILAMEDCLKEEAKYFPTFLMENIISVLEFGYTYANTLQKATSNRELLQCFQDIKRNKNRNLLIACFKENVQNDIFNEMNIPPKETMCGKMYSLNNCVKEVIKKVCINDVEIDTLIRDLVNALHKPCFNH